MAKKKVNYISNDELLALVIRDKAAGKLSNELAKSLMLIAENFSHHRYFRGYSYREDMVGSAILQLCENWQKFDETKYKNAFAYYTTACLRNFQLFMGKELKQAKLKDLLMVERGYESIYDDMDE